MSGLPFTRPATLLQTAAVLTAVFFGCGGSASDSETTSQNVVETPTDSDAGTTRPGTTEAGTTEPPQPEPAHAELPSEWPNNGSTDCTGHVNGEPSIYKFQYDANTWILRENKCLNFEANFIYLLFGNDKVLMQDTGSIPSDFGWTPAGQAKFKQFFPIRDTVEALITDWLAAHPNADGTPRTRDSMELLVTHTHSHGDHVSGDYQFKGPDGNPYPHTKIAGLRPQDVAAFFGITDWPNKAVALDLGGRRLDVLPIPGHENSHVAVYDHGAKLLLSGDSLYPGHLFVNNWTQYRASVQRLKDFVHENDGATGKPLRPIEFVLGTHIEKKPTAGQFYPYPSWVHNPERKLELALSDIDLLADKVNELGETSPHHEIFFADFALDPQ
jgi:hydroxyacylglutathione hydrolase